MTNPRAATLEMPNGAPPLLVLFDRGHEAVVRAIADGLGRASVIVEVARVGAWSSDLGVVLGVGKWEVLTGDEIRENERFIVNARMKERENAGDSRFLDFCNYEYLYTWKDLHRCGVAGQMRRQDSFINRPQSAELSLESSGLQSPLPDVDDVFELYAIGRDVHDGGIASFIQKYLNELGLPRQQRCIETLTPKTLGLLVAGCPKFGGAYLDDPMEAMTLETAEPSACAAQIGLVDILLPSTGLDSTLLVGDNVLWRAIRATLTQRVDTSVIRNSSAIVFGDYSSIDSAYAGIYALKDLNVQHIFCIGFQAKGALSDMVHHVSSVDDLGGAAQPFVVVSAVPPQRTSAVAPLLRFLNGRTAPERCNGGVLLDMANPVATKTLTSSTAAELGYTTYGKDDVQAWRVVEITDALINRKVDVNFVKEML